MTITLTSENAIIAGMVIYPLLILLIMFAMRRDTLGAFGWPETDYQGWGWLLLATPVVWMFGFAGLYLAMKYGAAK